jgi:hypothetical protein
LNNLILHNNSHIFPRRAKNKDGGQRLREDLSRYQCGIELQTGKRKSSQVTTFSTLCERQFSFCFCFKKMMMFNLWGGDRGI